MGTRQGESWRGQGPRSTKAGVTCRRTPAKSSLCKASAFVYRSPLSDSNGCEPSSKEKIATPYINQKHLSANMTASKRIILTVLHIYIYIYIYVCIYIYIYILERKGGNNTCQVRFNCTVCHSCVHTSLQTPPLQSSPSASSVHRGYMSTNLLSMPP